VFGTSTQSSLSAISAIAPHLENDLLFDLQGSAPVASRRVPTSVEPYKCPESCPGKTFGRQYELERHIREQHRCPHEDCSDVYFSSPKEKREHERHHSETGLGYRCGTCLLRGTPPKTLTRGEKLKKHFRDAHGVKEDFDFRNYQCMKESCHVSKAFGGIFFTAPCELEEHEMREHPSIVPISKLGESRADGKSATSTLNSRL
jgi:hypothetical protein